jgi:mannose-6-phosphate isomerase-like protein (cupin superfamily)
MEPGQTQKADVPPYGDSHYFVAGTRRAVKNIGKQSIPFVQVQFLRPQGKYVPLDVPASHYCNPEAPKACATERYLYCTDRLCAEMVTLDPGAASNQHTHTSDYIVVATSDFSWRNEPVGKAAFNESFKVGDVQYVNAGGTHRLVNTGGTTARMFVVQFK